jgi:hypothetical protein
MGKKKKKKKQRGSEQQTTRPLSGTIIPPVGPKRAVTSQSLVLLQRAAQTQSQKPLRLWAVQTLAEDSTPRLPAKPVPQFSLPRLPAKPVPQFSLPRLPAKPVPQYSLPRLPAKPVPQYSLSPSRTQSQNRDLALGRIQVERTLALGFGSFRFEYSKKWAPRRLDITLPDGRRLKVDGLTTNEIRQLLSLLKLSTLRQTGGIQSDPVRAHRGHMSTGYCMSL